MDVHPTPFPGNKTQSVKSKYKKISEPPKNKSKEIPIHMNRRTFGTIRNHNVLETTLPQNPNLKPKPSKNQISQPQPKTTQNESNEKAKLRNKKKKKTVCLAEKNEGSVKNKSPAREIKTPVRPPFSVKPVKIPGTPYLSAEKCSGCRFDRLETASYWIGQIKSAESVGKHFVAAAFFRLANECKAEPMKNLQVELKRYLTRHEDLSATAEWEDMSRMYGKLKNGLGTENGEKMSCFCEKTATKSGSTVEVVQEQRIENENGSGEINE